MTETITTRIGGEDIPLPLIMNFATLKRAWPAMKVMSSETDPIARIGAALAFLAAILLPTRPELSLAALESRLRVNVADGTDERLGVIQVVDRIVIASGLVPAGEAVPAAAETPPATATTT